MSGQETGDKYEGRIEAREVGHEEVQRNEGEKAGGTASHREEVVQNVQISTLLILDHAIMNLPMILMVPATLSLCFSSKVRML